VHYPFEFVIAHDAPGGDHNIIINYMYKFQNKWYSDDRIVTVHVNRFYEKTWFYIIALTISALSLIIFAAEFGKILVYIWKHIRGRL